MRTLELLAPAKNLECGIAAIDHGADAVYIGAPRFGARAAAGNSLDDIRELCRHAHQFGARIHVTVNTIIYDEELEDTLKMIAQLDEIGVDALIVQDMGVFQEVKARNLWSRELHSSTQCDTRTPEKAAWLHSVGFDRVILARELTLDQIKSIHESVPEADLEFFVHGALCVSYSGVCYASEKCFGRSANRGECAQFCRMKFDLLDSDGQEIEHQRHLLSLKDLCMIDHLKDLADAGICSFKIEGRLKDASYVKNVVAAYSKKLNDLVKKAPMEYQRASRGKVAYTFEPNLKKTFNRGFTTYFLKGRQPDIASFDTPKAMGEYVGKVKEIRNNVSFNVSTLVSFSNGDGLCFINDEHELEGFRVNRVQGNRLYPFRMPEHLRSGMALYRNNDRAFEAVMARTSAERKVPVAIVLEPSSEEHGGEDMTGVLASLYSYSAQDRKMTDKIASFFMPCELQEARKSQAENMKAQMSKLGNTAYDCVEVQLDKGIDAYFIPNSVLTAVRRELIEQADGVGVVECKKHTVSLAVQRMEAKEFVWTPEYGKWGYLYNIANDSAHNFYAAHGLEDTVPAFELGVNKSYAKNAKGESLIMQCRHCIRYSLGYCVKNGGKRPTWKEPLLLRLGDGRMFRLEFVCKECQMNIFSV